MRNLASSIFFSLLLFLFASSSARAQLTVDPTPTPQQLVQNVLVGNGVQVSNVTFSGDSVQIGKFDATNANSINMDEGLILATGPIDLAVGPNDDGGAGVDVGTGGDSDLEQALGGTQTYNAAVLEFDFKPSGDTIDFEYIFGSEEYLEYVDDGFNDVFGFFLSGPNINGPYSNNAINIATIPGTNTPVSIDSVNDADNSTYYINNGDGSTSPYNSDSAYVQYDGITTSLPAIEEVICDTTYHIKLAVGDAGDGFWDSGVLLKGGSFVSDAVEVDVTTVSGDSTIVEDCSDATFSFLRNDTSQADTINFDIGGDAVNGTDYAHIADSVIIPAGDTSAEVTIDALDDGVSETGLDTVNLTVYTINQCGDTIVNEASVFIMDVYDVPLTMTDQVLSCPMDSVPLTAQADSGIPDFDYLWSDGTTGDTAYLPGDSTDTLTVTATDSCGMTGEDTAIVDLQWSPLSLSLTPDTVFGCYGNASIDLIANASGGQAPYNYTWDPGGASGSSYTVSPSDSTVYQVSAIDSCEADTVSDSVLVEAPLDPIDIEVNTISADSSIVEGCTDGSFTFIRPDSNVFDTLYYSIGGNAVNGTDYAQIGDSVVYAPGDTAVSLTIDALVDGVTETTPDTLTLSTSFVNICGDTVETEASMYIVEDYQVEALTSDTTIFCPTDSVPIPVEGQGGNTPYSYSWSDGTNGDTAYLPGDATDTLSVVATDSCGQISDPDTVVLDFQYDSLSVSASSDTTVACPGDPVDLSASVSGGHTNYTYTWMPPNLNGQTVTVNPNASTGYEVSVSDSCGNETLTDSVSIQVPDPAPLNAMASDTTVQCEGDSISLMGSAENGFGGYSYDWTGGPNDSIWGLISFNDSTYVLEVTDACGYTDTAQAVVHHPDYDPLVLDPGPMDSTCEGDPLSVDADASGGAGDHSYEWSGNGSIQGLDDGKARITPKGGGFFNVSVTDACGNREQEEVFLGVMDCELHIPNVITPNGDSKNEAFVIDNLEHYPRTSIVIFNRWGNKVYQDDDYRNDWEGEDLSDGTYYFILRPRAEDLDPIEGQVTLFSDGEK